MTTGVNGASRNGLNSQSQQTRNNNKAMDIIKSQFNLQKSGLFSMVEAQAVEHDKNFQQLIQASKDVLDQYDQGHGHDDTQPIERKYYYVSILKKVHTYK